jgi:hypothetical protein
MSDNPAVTILAPPDDNMTVTWQSSPGEYDHLRYVGA